MLSLIVLAGRTENLDSLLESFGEPARTEFSCGWARANVYSEGWTAGALEDQRAGQLLESEWDLRIVILGPPFVGALFSNDQRKDQCSELLSKLNRVLGPGTWTTTREEIRDDLVALLEGWPTVEDVNLVEFWGKGQARANNYEEVLRAMLPDYNLATEGFLGYRPDFTVTPFKPCAVTAAITDDVDAINIAIRRDAHTFEFTAQRDPSAATLRSYLGSKLSNYVTVTQEQ